MERFLTRSAAQVYLVKNNQILFGKRSGDKIDLANGLWDVAGGHCNENESFTAAAKRIAKKEFCITFDEKDIKFTTIIHVGKNNLVGLPYICAHFFIDKWAGEPKIGEPSKMSCLKWININDLPANLNFDRPQAIQNFKSKTSYSETMF